MRIYREKNFLCWPNHCHWIFWSFFLFFSQCFITKLSDWYFLMIDTYRSDIIKLRVFTRIGQHRAITISIASRTMQSNRIQLLQCLYIMWFFFLWLYFVLSSFRWPSLLKTPLRQAIRTKCLNHWSNQQRSNLLLDQLILNNCQIQHMFRVCHCTILSYLFSQIAQSLSEGY